MARSAHGSTAILKGRSSSRFFSNSLAELGAKKRFKATSARHKGPSKRLFLNGGASLPNRRASKEALSNLRRIPFEKRDLVIANTIVNLLSRKENHAMALEDLKIRAELALTPNGNKRIVLMPKYFTNVYRKLVLNKIVVDSKMLKKFLKK